MPKFLILAACSLTFGATAAQAQSYYQEAVIEDVKVIPENGGINPDAFTYVIETKVLAGSNPCVATGVSVRLTQRRSAKALSITALKRIPASNGRICPQVWSPVYQTATIRVTGIRSAAPKVLINNVGSPGTVKSLEQILQTNTQLTITGVLTRVMAIGGETSGIAVVTRNGDHVEVDLSTNSLLEVMDTLEGREVVIIGKMVKKRGVEIPERNILVATDIRAID